MSRRTALIHGPEAISYAELAQNAATWRQRLESEPGVVPGARIAYLIPPGSAHVAALLGIWTAGCIAVPLASSHPPPEAAYVLRDADPVLVIVSEDARHAVGVVEQAGGQGRRVIRLAEAAEERATRRLHSARPPAPSQGSGALMIYTSGTTGRPKGVLTTHANIAAQIRALVQAWEWTADDHILHVLPLHHIHGLVNVLGCALWSGATCEFCRPDPSAIWERMADPEITLFMAVPTVYRRLIQAWETAPAQDKDRWSKGAASLRLMVSGSAALPVHTLDRWREITGQTLLERYGMTEIGMGLSNPLGGERRSGHVGQPLPGVEVRIVAENGDVVPTGSSGEIEVRGPQVFSEYWRRPGETEAAFRDGWFRTGDEGVLEDGYYRILGRRSVDILKTGGYKVSALEIEDVYRGHPAVADLAVVGVPDPDWGERVSAAWIPIGEDLPSTEEFREWGKQHLAPYKVPRVFEAVDALPRNAMGKVQKRELVTKFSQIPMKKPDAQESP